MFFDSFGVMLDCSRNAVMQVEELKRYISTLNRMGYNQFQLYTEETYEVEGEPYFGLHRGRYTVEELQDIDAYCRSLGVELVPNIQTLAHLNAALRWPEYHPIIDHGDILLVGHERTYELIERMFQTLRKAFTSNKVHIGMDEAHMLGRGRYMDLHGTVERSDILLQHLNRVCEIADKYGFEPMMWSDMFYRLANGGEYYAAGTSFSEETKAKIPEKLTLVYWDYYRKERKHYDGMIRGHQALCERVAFAGGAWKWSGFTPHNSFSIQCTKAAISSCIRNGVRDVFITAWGDDGAEASAWSVLPTLAYAACLAQGITKLAEIKAKFAEWVGCSYDDFMLLELPDKFGPGNNNNPSKYALYNDCFMGLLDRNVADTDSKTYLSYSRRLKNAAKRAGEFAYLFEAAAKLCYLLSVKVDLGIRTKEAFFSGEPEAVEAIIKDYNKAIKRTEEFYAAFKRQWFKENKPHGFDVQDIRLGGLLQRLRSCRDRLVEYARGDISDIPELHDDTPVVWGDQHIIFNCWMNNVSANVIYPV